MKKVDWDKPLYHVEDGSRWFVIGKTRAGEYIVEHESEDCVYRVDESGVDPDTQRPLLSNERKRKFAVRVYLMEWEGIIFPLIGGNPMFRESLPSTARLLGSKTVTLAEGEFIAESVSDHLKSRE